MSATRPNKPVIAVIRELREDDVFTESSDFHHDFTANGAEKTVRTVGFRTKVIIVSEDTRSPGLKELEKSHAEAFMVAHEIGGRVARLLECHATGGNRRYEFVEVLSEAK